MQVKLEKKHRIEAPVEAAWNVLKDLRAVAECMPGASITERTGDNKYKGVVKVRVGPVQSSFGGTIDVTDVDEARHSMALSAKGKDSSGSSNASMQLTALVRAVDGGGCELTGNSEIKVMGKMASFGARMINGVADQLISQFLENFSSRVLAAGEGAAAIDAASKLAEQPKDLNALALVWGLVAGFFRRLFGRADTR